MQGTGTRTMTLWLPRWMPCTLFNETGPAFPPQEILLKKNWCDRLYLEPDFEGLRTLHG